MIEPTMRERVARAICRVDALNTRQAFPDDVDAFVDAYWESDIPAADAVLAEMEAPTDAMLSGLWNAGVEAGDYVSNPDEACAVWQTMIAEARK